MIEFIRTLLCKPNKSKRTLVKKDAVLYLYNTESGSFNKFPSVYIYKTKDQYQAVGIQYTVNDNNCIQVSQKENDVFFDTDSGDLLLWTSVNFQTEDVMQMFRQILQSLVDKNIDDFINYLVHSKRTYMTISTVMNDGHTYKNIPRQDLKQELINYVFGY